MLDDGWRKGKSVVIRPLMGADSTTLKVGLIWWLMEVESDGDGDDDLSSSGFDN